MSKFELFGNHFRKLFCWCTVSGIVFRGYYPHTGNSPFICPSLSTWRKSAILETPEEIFLPGETHAAHLARHPSPLHGKNRANWHHLQKIFSARESSSNVQNRAFWKTLSKSFSNCFAQVSTAIDHPCESCQHNLLSAASYCPLPFYVKIEAKWKHFLKFFAAVKLMVNICPTFFYVKIRAKWHRQFSLQPMWLCWTV